MLYLLPSPLGNLSDTTFRVLEVLQKSTILLCEDTRITHKLISLFEQRGWLKPFEREYISLHSHNQDAFLDSITPDFFQNEVAFLSDAGMPCISDPGSALVRYALQHQIEYEVLPAGSASALAYSYSGFSDDGFVFDGFLPHKSRERKERLAFWKRVLAEAKRVLVVFESPHRIVESVEDLQEVDSTCNVFLIKEMTKMHQKSFRGCVAKALEWLAESNLSGEWCMVVAFGTYQIENRLGCVEIAGLDIPPKIKAKLLAKITGKTPKECYAQYFDEKLQ
ncbi:16S rRNA (cytidine(1402)-2'-O)-methyltransferase [Helicobacter enhydrae]|uniref:Ribosomal RNA small subunit methyltransferase I n=1 Tax=Helicobacter enhydrae TaxID=222136 RepID=A0A1B1U5W5_9HELI|nr:16S rRNA (cytidine(1402)-2'-O)-methyltransferase [Helicobacter enhydrae]ANV98085.1 16S rRNA (cytidine(1402)-2'-O)-methyltransferase [Helicobacter enhydrae]